MADKMINKKTLHDSPTPRLSDSGPIDDKPIADSLIGQSADSSFIVYEPDRAIKLSFVAQWREMAVDLFRSRELIWRLFLRDFQAKYKQSLLGLAWVVINPLVAIALFVFLNSAGILSVGNTGVPYVVFAIVGLTIWNLFAVGLTAGANSIVNAGPMVTKINFPKVSLVFAAAGQSLVEFGVRLILSGAILAAFRVIPSWTVIFLPFALLPLLLLTLGLALILALLAGVFRDIANVITLATTFLMFFVPVLYPVPKAGIAAKIAAVNPLVQLVVGPRDLVFSGSFVNAVNFAWSSVFALLVFLFCWRLFFLAETKIAERV